MSKGSTTAQLKADIDSGRTGSKVAGLDLGASPLGTDSEAGGNSATPGEIDQARALESRPALGKRDVGRSSVGQESAAPDGRVSAGVSPVLIGVGLGVVAAIAVGGGLAATVLLR